MLVCCFVILQGKNIVMAEYASIVSVDLHNSTLDSTISDVSYMDESVRTRQEYPSLNNSKWAGKKFVTFGDSITWYDGNRYINTHIEKGQLAKGYQSYMRERLGCIIDNQGVSGYNMTEIWMNRISGFDFDKVDAVTITSGANDHKNGILPGVVLPIGSTFDVNTYAGAIQASVEKIIIENPDAKIFLITPVQGWYNEKNTTNVPGPYNMEMTISKDYVDVMKEIGLLYGLPVCDLFNLTGINDLTRPTFIGDKETMPYYLHPTNKGYERMAEILIPFLGND